MQPSREDRKVPAVWRERYGNSSAKRYLVAFIGGAFGFVLQRFGASNASNIMNMLALRDLKIMKVVLLAIAISSAGIYLLHAIDPGLVHLSVKTAYVGVIIGGLIFGIGFALAGYCPGTSLCAIGEGRKDALFFVAGGLFGALIFMLVYGSLKSSWLFTKIAGGKATLADTGIAKYPVLIEAFPAVGVALTVVAIMVFVAWRLPERDARTKT